MVTRALLIALAACSCQGSGTDGTTYGSGAASAVARDARAGGMGVASPVDAVSILFPDDARTKPDEIEAPDPGKLIAELGAIPAWQAVVDRARLLARRKQRGIVYGRIGPVAAKIDAGTIASPYVWLVDDTEGNGTLGIRVKLDGRAAKEGDRVALGGAWDVDAERAWYWNVDAVQPVPAAAPSDVNDPIAPLPTHEITSGELPTGARTISVARDNDAVYFQVVGPPPTSDGDGWQIADELGNPVFALINLPGERASYGGQDMRASDERWQLKRGQTYWVRIGKLRKRGIDKPALVNARTAPVRVM